MIDDIWHGFLPNVRDTKIMSSYVDENFPAGLKANSKRLLNYDQTSYEDVTRRDYVKSEWDGVGKVLQTHEHPESGVEHVIVERKMNQLTAQEVLSYGCDDTICTIALANFFTLVMEIENTYDVFEQVETYPAYLTALAYVQGTAFSLASMAEQEKDDNATYAAAEPILHDYLMAIGFDGTRYEPITILDPAGIKRAFLEMSGTELLGEDGQPARVRTTSKLVKLIEMQDPESILPALINEVNIATINTILSDKFEGRPSLELGSTKQMKDLLYNRMGIPVRVINDVTETERNKQPALSDAVTKFKRIRSGKSDGVMQPQELELMKIKGKTDSTAIETALAFDIEMLDEAAVMALESISSMKQVMTRRSLFYSNYWKGLHWKDGKLHSNMNQCAAVTRRYSSSDQNLTQLPKRLEGVRFREHFKPHSRDSVIASEDFSSQEIRLAAHESQDPNLMACYVGDNLRDLHSTTASGAMRMKWGAKVVEELFQKYLPDAPRENVYELFLKLRKLPKGDPMQKKADDLRKDSKNVVFASFYGGQAAKISETLVMPLVEAQIIIDAKRSMFPGLDTASERIERECKDVGYATTMLGARRHLQEPMLSGDKFLISQAARQAFNMRIQGSAAEMTKLAMSSLWLSGAMHRFDVRFIAPIHDELVVSVSREHAVEYLGIQHACMTQQYANMTVPIVGSISIGKNFGQQIECGDGFFPDAIQGALNDIFYKEALAA